MATHDKALVDRMRRRVIELDKGEMIRGPKSVVSTDRRRRDNPMRVYFRYAVKETLSNLWRNRMMTIPAVLTVAVSLSLVGSALLLNQRRSGLVAVGAGTRVTVWMEPRPPRVRSPTSKPNFTICQS